MAYGRTVTVPRRRCDAPGTVAVKRAGQPAETGTRSVLLARTLWALAMLGLIVPLWYDHLTRRAGRPDLAGLSADDIPYALAVVSAVTVGATIASRRSRHPVGWLLLALGLSVIASGAAESYGIYWLLARSERMPAAVLAAVYFDRSWILIAGLIGFILLLTPTGSLPSPRWRWWAWVAAVAPLVAMVTPRSGTLEAPFTTVEYPLAGYVSGFDPVALIAVIITNLAVAVTAASLVVRFRYTHGVERQQLRWVAFAAALAVVAIAVILVSWALGVEALWVWASGAYVGVLPLAIGAAVLRYRLYDLDRIVSRTLSYGLLTVMLGLSYTGAVLILGQLVGSRSNVAVAGAILAAAAVLQPARRRLQDVVDRRFNRRRYDAVRITDAFGRRLRHEIDLGTLTGELLTVVDQSVQPSSASLWLPGAPDTDGPATGRAEHSWGPTKHVQELR